MKKNRFTIFVLILCTVALIGGEILCEMGNGAMGATVIASASLVFITIYAAEVFGAKGKDDEKFI